MSEESPTTETAYGQARRLPRWKQAVLALSVVSVGFGFALGHFESPADVPPRATGAGVEVASSTAERAPTLGAAGEAVPGVSTPTTHGEALALAMPDGERSPTPQSLEREALSHGASLVGTSGFLPGASVDPSAVVGLPTTEPRASTTTPEPDLARAAAALTLDPATPDPGSGDRATREPSRAGSSSAPWSPLFVKGGLSVFVGFCVGHALRAFFKLAAIALGLAFLTALGLQYQGILNLDWSAVSDFYDVAAVRVATELQSLGTFLNGSLPSAGLASFGLFAGFKRSG